MTASSDRKAGGHDDVATRSSCLKPFPVGSIAQCSDERAGKILLGYWIGFQAELRGIDPATVPRNWAETLVSASRQLDTDELQTLPVTKAVRLASDGEWTRAGKLLRQIIDDGAIAAQNSKFARAHIRFYEKQRVSANRGTKVRLENANTARRNWLMIGGPLRKAHPMWSAARLATEIARKTGNNATTIRLALPSLNLSRRPKT